MRLSGNRRSNHWEKALGALSFIDSAVTETQKALGALDSRDSLRSSVAWLPAVLASSGFADRVAGRSPATSEGGGYAATRASPFQSAEGAKLLRALPHFVRQDARVRLVGLPNPNPGRLN